MIINNAPSPQYGVSEDDSLNWIPSKKEMRILKAARYTCACCSLQSRATERCPTGYLEIVTIDGVDDVLCSFCAQSQYIGRAVNGRSNNGLIIYCPGLTQGHVSALAQKLFYSRHTDDQNSEKARSLISRISSELVNPVSLAIADFESGTSRQFGAILDNLSPKAWANIQPLLASLRYWPYEEVFSNQVTFWSENTKSHLNGE